MLYRPIQPTELLLPQDQFSALIDEIRPFLYREDAHWLASWEYYDQTHEMDDPARAEARRRSYQDWYKRLLESMVPKR
jgi:hypothetical protein